MGALEISHRELVALYRYSSANQRLLLRWKRAKTPDIITGRVQNVCVGVAKVVAAVHRHADLWGA